MTKKSVIAIIPARKNSKRIPKKNYKLFNGKPIITYTIKLLKKSKLFDKIIVSTDSEKIASISKKCGATILFKRPKNLSGDYVSSAKAVKHAVNFLIKKNYSFNYVCCVYAPNPFLRISDLNKGFKKIKSNKYNFVFSATGYNFPIFRSFIFSKSNGVEILFKKYFRKRSQDLKKIYCDAGQFYWGAKEIWLRKKRLTNKSCIIDIPKFRYHDIDTLDDWKKAEIYKKIIK